MKTQVFYGKISILALFVSLLICSSLTAQPGGVWVTKANLSTVGGLPTWRSLSTCANNGKGYLTGGGTSTNWYTTANYEYDPVANTWTTKAPHPNGPVAEGQSVVYNNEIYMLCGTLNGQRTTLCRKYNTSTNTWAAPTAIAPFPGMGRAMHVAAIVGSKAYVGLGVGPWPGNAVLKDWYEYDIINNTWTPKAMFPGNYTVSKACFALNGKIYVGLGANTANQPSTDWYEYNPATNTWTAKANFPGPARSEVKGFTICNYGYITCGYNFSTNTNYKDLWEYNATNDSWKQMTSLPVAMGRFSAGSAFSIADKAYVGQGCALNGASYAGQFSDLYEWHLPAYFKLSPDSICGGTTFNLIDSSYNHPASWNWIINGPASLSYTTQNVYNVNLTTAGNYTITLKSFNACGDVETYTHTLLVISNPATPVSSTITVCENKPIYLTTAAAPTYSWVGPAFNSSIQSPTITSAALSNAGNYSITVGASMCKSTGVVKVIVNSNPTLTITKNDVDCNGNLNGLANAIVVGNAPFAYAWSTTPAQNVANASGLGAGTYSVNVTDNNGCKATGSVQINEPPVLNVAVSSDKTQACIGQNINVNSNISGGTPGYSYTWSPSHSGPSFAAAETQQGVYNYVLNVTDAKGCHASNGVSVKFFSNPTVTVSKTTQTLCAGETIKLDAFGADNYMWLPTNAGGNSFTMAAGSDMFVTVIGTNGSGCSAQAQSFVKVNQLPVVNIEADKIKGCTPVCVNYTATSTSSLQSVSWDFGDGGGAGNFFTTQRCYNHSGNYNVEAMVTDKNGCKNKANILIQSFSKPVADFNFSPSHPILNGEEIEFVDASAGEELNSWFWSFTSKNDNNIAETQNTKHYYDEAGTYPVTMIVRSANGCADSITKFISVGEDFGLFVPNSFTPNNDGLNDIFQPKGTGITKYEMQVFDRWGQKLFTTNSFEEGWDGTIKGAIAKQDSYVWKITLTNNFGKSKDFTGNITLMP